MDCCHSGTGLDLPYDYKFGSGTGHDAGQKLPFGIKIPMPTATNYASGRWVEDVNPAHSKGDVVLFSGCEDDQTSADTKEQYTRTAGGAMTQAFLASYQQMPNASYPDFLAALHKNLKSRGFRQRPQLTASQQFDVSHARFSVTGANGIQPNRNAQIGRMKRRHIKPGKAGSGGAFDIDDFLAGKTGKYAAAAVGVALLASILD